MRLILVTLVISVLNCDPAKSARNGFRMCGDAVKIDYRERSYIASLFVDSTYFCQGAIICKLSDLFVYKYDKSIRS